MKAVIMAGGKGTRLRPLTCHLPKPMVPLTGRPCMEYIIELLHGHGIVDIAVTMQYLPDVIRDYFGDGSRHGVRLHYFEETSPLGTAGSVKNAEAFLDERFLVISGDALTDFDLSAAVRYHEQQGALATLVLTRVEQPLEYGVVMTDDAGRVVRFLEKPGWGEVFSDTVNTGIYILEPEALSRFEPGVEYDFSHQLFPSLLQAGDPLYGFVADGYWSDVGSLEQYRQTQFDMLSGKVRVRLPGREVRPGIYVGDNVTVSPNVTWVGPAYIGDGSVLEDGVEIGEYCIVGQGNTLARGSVLRRAILWDYNHLAPGNELHGATFASRIVSRESSLYADGCVVGSHCTVGPKASVRPQVKIWPGKQIQENARLTTSFIWGQRHARSLFRALGVPGTVNVELTPEFAARFATAYGATLGAGKTLTVSSSPDDFARLLKRTITAGLQSVGVHVVDLGDALPSMARFAVRQLSASGGLHVQLGDDGREGRFECYDADGLPLAKNAERKVENAFWQEDYGRAPAGRTGSYRTDETIAGLYTGTLLACVRFQASRAEPYRLAVGAPPAVFAFLYPLLTALHCEPVHLPAPAQGERLGEWTAALSCDLGLRFEGDGRLTQLYTPDGTAATSEQLLLLQYLAYFHSRPGAVVGAPVSAPALLDSLAEGLGCRVVRTKEHSRSVMEASAEQALHPLFDGLYAAGLLMQHVNRTGLDVGELLSLLPGHYLERGHVDCPWERKGHVMRHMIRLAEGRPVELVDGIKVYHEDGSVLLLPDADEPMFRIVAQGERHDSAASLLNQYREHILNLIQ